MQAEKLSGDSSTTTTTSHDSSFNSCDGEVHQQQHAVVMGSASVNPPPFQQHQHQYQHQHRQQRHQLQQSPVVMEKSGGRARRRKNTLMGTGLLVSILFPIAATADCIPLGTSLTCRAFGDSQVSTSDALTSQ